jgi:hypothetical protein
MHTQAEFLVEFKGPGDLEKPIHTECLDPRLKNPDVPERPRTSGKGGSLAMLMLPLFQEDRETDLTTGRLSCDSVWELQSGHQSWRNRKIPGKIVSVHISISKAACVL